MGRIFTIGEALIDFIPIEAKKNLKQVESFNKMPGGAPANVAVAAAKLGGETYFIGMLGKDSFGEFLLDTLKNYGVKTDYVAMTSKAKTALAFVSLDHTGERDFSFYRNPSADLLLSVDDVKNIVFKEGDCISFCSVDLVDFPVKEATEFLLKKAKEKNAIILFDPNVRKDLWDNLEDCKRTILYFLQYVDIVKISDDELEFITGEKELEKAVLFLKKRGVKNIIITLGKNGALAYFSDKKIFAEGYEVKNCVDTTGAGDAFVGATLYQLSLLKKSLNILDENEIYDILRFSNRVAAMVTTKKGAMNALPTLEEIR